MNEEQSVVLEMLKSFLRICDKLNLRYYLVNGSALGAVKYSGFIAWDDDVDVAMPRKDYEIFCEKAQSMLPDNIFLQNYRTDPRFPQIYSKLRNSDTTFIETGSEHLPINHGCYLDIFPLDDYPKEGRTRFDCFRLKLFNILRVCALNDRRTKRIIIRNRILRFLGFHRRTAVTIARIEAILTKYKENGEYWCNFGDRQCAVGPFPKSYYGKGHPIKFENIEVFIPEKYDEYFTAKYGDWREEPPEDSRSSHHTTVLVDVHKPYTEYIGT